VKVWVGATVAAVLAAAIMGRAGLGEADDKRVPIDCSETDLQFTGERFDVECVEFKGRQIHHSEGSAQVQTRVLFADSTRAPDWLIAIDSRVLGSLAIRRIGIEDNIGTYFKELPIKDWKSVPEVQGFETAEFVSIGDGEVRDCIAFQRFFNRRYNGFSRWLVGVSCSSDGKEVAYQVLAGFSGPGG